MLTRRAALAGSLLAVPALGSLRAVEPTVTAGDVGTSLAKLEQSVGGHLGVALLSLDAGDVAGHRLHERFLMCSTFKALAAGLVLARVDRKEEHLSRRVFFATHDLVEWSPLSAARAGAAGMTIAELCEAAVTQSDNTAANLLLQSFGGPPALTRYLRALGDTVTRLDRIEPALNEHEGPGDMRDTTTPQAMLETLRVLLFDDALTKSSRARLAAWLIAGKTGDRRLRAGFPAEWLVGDKTGTNRSGTAADIGVAWPPRGGAVIAAAYYRNPEVSLERRESVLAEVGRIAARL